MKNHVKVYLDHFGYSHDQEAFIPSEVSGQRATQIHHIEPRGMGGSKTKDTPENLIALTFEEHERAEHRRKPWLYKDELKLIHNRFIHERERLSDSIFKSL